MLQNVPFKMLLILAAILLAFNGAGALFGGYHLMRDPSGGTMQLQKDFLVGSPFPDYFIPGVVLFTLIGILSLVTLGYVLFQKKGFSNLLIVQGTFLVVWFMVQVFSIREFHYLQVVFGGIGLFLIFAGKKFQQIEIKRSKHASPSS